MALRGQTGAAVKEVSKFTLTEWLRHYIAMCVRASKYRRENFEVQRACIASQMSNIPAKLAKKLIANRELWGEFLAFCFQANSRKYDENWKEIFSIFRNQVFSEMIPGLVRECSIDRTPEVEQQDMLRFSQLAGYAREDMNLFCTICRLGSQHNKNVEILKQTMLGGMLHSVVDLQSSRRSNIVVECFIRAMKIADIKEALQSVYQSEPDIRRAIDCFTTTRTDLTEALEQLSAPAPSQDRRFVP